MIMISKKPKYINGIKYAEVRCSWCCHMKMIPMTECICDACKDEIQKKELGATITSQTQLLEEIERIRVERNRCRFESVVGR